MQVERLSLTCECGRPCSTFVQVGLTSDHQLVFNWWCDDCGEAVYAFRSLAECWRNCPPKEQVEVADEPTASNVSSTESDSAFLSAVGIALPVDVPLPSGY